MIRPWTTYEETIPADGSWGCCVPGTENLEEDYMQEVAEGLFVKKSGTKRKATSQLTPGLNMEEKLDRILAGMVAKDNMGVVNSRLE